MRNKPASIHHAIATHTRGFALAADLEVTSWNDIEKVSGRGREELEDVAVVYAKSNATIVTYLK